MSVIRELQKQFLVLRTRLKRKERECEELKRQLQESPSFQAEKDIGEILDVIIEHGSKCLHCDAVSSVVPKESGRVCCPMCYESITAALAARDAVIRELVAGGDAMIAMQSDSWDALTSKALALLDGEKGEGK